MRNTPVKKFVKRSKGSFIDDSMYVVGLIAPLMTLPQVIAVWTASSTKAISLPTWFAYAIVSFLWTFYGMYKKEYPVALTNFLLFLFDSAVVLGVVLR